MNDQRRKQAEEAAKNVNELVSDSAGCDRSGCRCWQAVSDLKTIRDFCDREIASSVHEDLKTPMPDAGDEEAANKYWRDNRDYHDSDGVDVAQVFKDGIAHARRTQAAEIDRLKVCFKADMNNWNKVDDERLSQIKELRALLERAKGFADFVFGYNTTNGINPKYELEWLSDYAKLQEPKESKE